MNIPHIAGFDVDNHIAVIGKSILLGNFRIVFNIAGVGSGPQNKADITTKIPVLISNTRQQCCNRIVENHDALFIARPHRHNCFSQILADQFSYDFRCLDFFGKPDETPIFIRLHMSRIGKAEPDLL